MKNKVIYRNKSYSVWEYLLRIFFVALLSIIFFNIWGNKNTPLSSFISISVIFLLITVFLAGILLKSREWILFFVLAYLIKLSIGFFHYLYFIDPLYFLSKGNKVYLTRENAGVFSEILNQAHEKIKNGLLYYSSIGRSGSHSEILNFISIPFIYSGDYILTLAPINTFFSILTSINILIISKFKLGFENKKLKYIAILTAYFPMTLISSLIYRDIVGIALMSIGLLLIILSKRFITQFLMVIIAAYLFYLHRTVYPVILLIAFIVNILINPQYKQTKFDLYYKIGIIILIISLMPFFLNLSNTKSNLWWLKGALNVNPLVIPIKIVVGLIGPFPWTQFLSYKTIPINAYQLEDYLQGVFNITFIISILIRSRRYFRKTQLNILNITGLILIITGLANVGMFITYVSVGFIFLVPWLFTQINLNEFIKIYKYSFIALIILNIVFVVFLGNLGISFLWK